MRAITPIATGLLASTCFASVAFAQAAPSAAEDSSESEIVVSEIVVTAQKREQVLNDVPMSITAISGSALVDRGITDIQSLVKVTPGLSYADSGYGTPVYSLRGVGYFDTSLGARPAVTVYSDELVLPFSIMSQGAALDLQRVEVLKGPQGTLFGQNSTGGAINYVAARPAAEASGGLTASLSSFSTSDASAYVNLPLSPTLGVRASGRLNLGGDWQRNYTRNESLGQKFFYQGRIILDWKPSDRVTFVVGANGFHDGGDTQAAQLIAVGYSSPTYASQVPIVGNQPVAPRNNRAADWDPGLALRKDNSFYQFSLRSDVKVGDAVTLTSLTGYSHMTVNQMIDQDGTPAPASRAQVQGKLSSFSQELRANIVAGPAMVVIGGTYTLDKSYENTLYQFPYTTSSYSTIPGLRATSSGLNSDQRFSNKAVFGNVDLELSDQLTLHGGLRYTDVQLHYRTCATAGDATSAGTFGLLVNVVRSRAGLGPVPLSVGDCVSLSSTLQPGALEADLNEDSLSWRVGLDYKPIAGTLLYVNVSRGFKSGSGATLPAIQQSQLAPVTQESVLAYEAGFKSSLIRNRLDVTGAIFYYDYDDKQVQGRRPTLLGVLPGLVNVPRSRIQGAEFQINAYPIRPLRLTFAGTYLDSKVIGDFNNYTSSGFPANFKDNPFPFTPKYQLVFDGEFTPRLNDRLDGLVGVSVNYRSSTTSAFGNDPLFLIDGYTTVDARIGVKDSAGQWSASLFARNLTDTYYWTSVGRVSDVVRRFTGQPRVVGVQFSVGF